MSLRILDIKLIYCGIEFELLLKLINFIMKNNCLLASSLFIEYNPGGYSKFFPTYIENTQKLMTYKKNML